LSAHRSKVFIEHRTIACRSIVDGRPSHVVAARQMCLN
jgi:predicted enzyme related to lactoylglutathione lyase